MTPRGRKKGSRNKSTRRPNNLHFWMFVLRNEDEVNAFLSRGDARQKGDIKQCLLHLKRANRKFFDEVNGQKILKELKNG